MTHCFYTVVRVSRHYTQLLSDPSRQKLELRRVAASDLAEVFFLLSKVVWSHLAKSDNSVCEGFHSNAAGRNAFQWLHFGKVFFFFLCSATNQESVGCCGDLKTLNFVKKKIAKLMEVFLNIHARTEASNSQSRDHGVPRLFGPKVYCYWSGMLHHQTVEWVSTSISPFSRLQLFLDCGNELKFSQWGF